MPEVKIFWDPQGLAIDSLGTKQFLRATDGDTPYISLSVRMLSIDAPETHYPGNSRPSNSDAELARLVEWIYQGHAPIDDQLAAFKDGRVSGSGGPVTLKSTGGPLKQMLILLIISLFWNGIVSMGKSAKPPASTRRG